MKFKVDENLPAELVSLLSGAGHDAASVPDQKLGGAADPSVAAVCQTEDRVLITLDLDFADIRNYPPGGHPGIIVLRLGRQDTPHILAVARSLLPVLATEPIQHHTWIVEEGRVRIRGAQQQ